MKNHNLTAFDISMVKLMTCLYKNNGINDEVMDILCDLDFEYQSLLNSKIILEDKVPIDPKTNLLKDDEKHFLTILKTVSRTLDRSLDELFNVSVVRFDIDNFKTINSEFGTDRGDIILLDIAGILMMNSRPTDFIIRHGGEEFDVILPTTNINGAVTYTDKIFSVINERNYEFERDPVNVSISAGISSASFPSKELKKYSQESARVQYKGIIQQADDAMHEAKIEGGNMYRIYNDTKDYAVIREQYTKNKLKRPSS